MQEAKAKFCDADVFKVGNTIFAYIGCDANGLDLLNHVKDTNKKQIIVSTSRVTEANRRLGFAYLTKLITENPDTPVYITGCDALLNKEAYLPYGQVISLTQLKDHCSTSTKVQTKLNTQTRPRNLVEIQRGCSHPCAYCFFPQAQGPSKSKHPYTIAKECLSLIQTGIDHIELISTDACSYCYTVEGKIFRYSDLLALILKTCGNKLKKLNIGTLDPGSSEIFRVLKVVHTSPILEDSVHIAVQSGSNTVLKRMKRRHTVEDIHKVHRYIPNMQFTWDIIVGFPGETGKEFADTYNLVKELKPIDFSVYVYTPQPNTEATTLPNQIIASVAQARKRLLDGLKPSIKRFYTETNREIAETLKEPRSNDTKFIQYELWKDCGNNCSFCYNKNQPKEHDKIGRMRKIKSLILSAETKRYNTMGFIGGELFDTRLLTATEQDCFIDLIQSVSELVKSGQIRRVYITSNLIYFDTSLLVRLLDWLKRENTLPAFCICTSWDISHRFKTSQDKALWERNMEMLHTSYPELMLHVETIITQDLIDAVMSGKLDLRDFKTKYNASVDYMAPNAGYNYASKAAFAKDVPGFFPTRDSFLTFLRKVCIEQNMVDIKSLFKRELQCDCIYFKSNGQEYKITDRVKTMTPFPCDIPRLVGYIDSDIFMKADVKTLREML